MTRTSWARNASRHKAPACTHITMEQIPRSYIGGDACPSCGNCRTLGFLYVCRQERDIAYLENLSAQKKDVEYLKKSDLRRELEHIGLSESVIATAEQGFYTDEQLEKLKAGKSKLNQIIADTLQAARIRNVIAACKAHGQPNTDGSVDSTLQVQQEPVPSCQLLACHHCRPYFRDRIFMSFDAVFEEKIRPIQPTEADYLPVKSAQIMRDINSRPIAAPSSIKLEDLTPSTLLSASGFSDVSPSTPSQSSTLTYKTTQSEIDSLNTTRRRRRRFYTMGHRSSGEISRDLTHQMTLFSRQGLKDAFKGVFRAAERESSSSGSNITLPMPRTAAARGYGGAASMGEFDLGALHRVKRQKERCDLRHASSHGTCSTTCEVANGGLRRQRSSRTDGESDSSGSRVSVYSCASEGSEVEVEGGVALTEEAVERHTPDIISDPLALEDIMTQA
ncbi:hypothetical protein BU23DRAFT_255591 [Bimuria novae-zelandiae CBS 107.79]|uniref:Uncharacterized protein n=1 Tax=Bimuria novae-zelandiae CBS 107.79 TaxID=1447943 RepID=A0A6A5UW41_9PLEO|nr:hypothetical protein BU23DRAFT_255591 [Bimuria novae-zelandiae CBS 107.79]